MIAIPRTLVNTGFALLGYVCLYWGSAGLQAQTSLPQQPAAAEDAKAKQQTAIAAMQESIARQRASVQRQLGQSAGGFFVLPPPAHTDGIGIAEAAAPECPPLPDDQVRALAGEAARHEGLDEVLLLNVMRQESGYRPCAVSAKGAMGLMQLMPSTGEELGVKDFFDPAENVDAGAKFLRQLLTRYNGDVIRAVSAYNAGPARVDAADGIPQIPETLDYINRILYSGFEKQ